MKKVLLVLAAFALLFTASPQAKAQGSKDYTGGMKIKLNDEGSKYIRFITWHQFQGIYSENPEGGSTDNFSTKLRRSRLLAFAQMNKKFMIITHFGINSQSASSGAKKPQLYMHDVWLNYTLLGGKSDFTMDFGAGLHYWNGLSRMTMSSTLNYLQLDAPIFNWPNIEKNDQFARQMGYYIKGAAGNIKYNFSAVEPFKQAAPTLVNGGPAQLNSTDSWAFNGYLAYQFADKESTFFPFHVGTYVGTKSVFNVGAGFYMHPKGSIIADGSGNTSEKDIMLFAVDAFYDQPMGGDMALTAYGVFYSYNFGDNYLRGTSGGTLFGTGSIIFAQAGLLLPGNILSDTDRLQPFVGFSFRDLEGAPDSFTHFDVGANWFLDGHNAKITCQYSTVPYISGTDIESYSQFIVQTQIYL